MISRRRRDRSAAPVTGHRSPSDPVDAVLIAAAQAGTDAELSRENEALAYFRAARSQPWPEEADRPAAPHRFKNRLVGVSVGVAAAVTGVAAAGATGVLPAPLQRPAHRIFHVPAPGRDKDQPTPTSDRTAGTGTARPTSPPRSTSGSAPPSSASGASTSSGRPSDSPGPTLSTPSTGPSTPSLTPSPTGPPTTVRSSGATSSQAKASTTAPPTQSTR